MEMGWVLVVSSVNLVEDRAAGALMGHTPDRYLQSCALSRLCRFSPPRPLRAAPPSPSTHSTL